MTDTDWIRGQTLYADALDMAFGRCIDRAGDTMSGEFVLAGDPVMPMDAATKQYVDNRLVGSVPPTAISVTISDNPPIGAVSGALWWNTTVGQLYVYYDDGTSKQWVVANSVAIGAVSGTVTQIDTGTGLTGGPITKAGVISLGNTPVTAGSYTNANITVDAQGRITAAANGLYSNGTVTSLTAGTGLLGGTITTSGTLSVNFGTTAGTVVQGNDGRFATIPAPAGILPIMDGTATVGVSTTYAHADHVHPSDTTRAPLTSPGFGGAPTAPTPAPGTNNTQLATTAFVNTAISGSVAGVSSFNTRTGDIVLSTADVTGAGGAPLVSPAFSGTPTAPTPAAADNSTAIATTAWARQYLASVPEVSSFNTRTGAVTLTLADVTAVADPVYVNVAGDTMTGPLVVPGLSCTNVVASTPDTLTRHISLFGGSYGFNVTAGELNYVGPAASVHQFRVGAAAIGQFGSTGLAMFQPITLPSDPTIALQAATKQYVDNAVLAPSSDTPPASPKPGQLWFDTAGGHLYVWYQDVSSSQWIGV